jgi:DNA-binding transcriptional LysR family regulator
MDLNDIVVFTRVVQTGSFTAASHALDMTKSSVSRKVSELEDRVGARLLQRSTRKLGLTDIGRAYYQHCARIVSEMEEADLAVSRMQESPRGLLRVSVPLAFGKLGNILSELLKKNPELQLEIVATDRRVDLIEEGFDLALRAGPLEDSTLIARQIGAVKRPLVAAPSYLKKHGAPKTPADLEKHACLVFSAAQWTLRTPGKSVTVNPPSRLVVNDFDILREAAKSGLGIASVPEHLVRDDLSRKRLRRILSAWCTAETPLYAVYPSARHLSPKVNSFIEAISKNFATIFSRSDP